MYAPTPACEGGIRAVSYHVLFTYIKKLSPGLREESIPSILTTVLSEVFFHAAKENNAAKRNSEFFMNKFLSK